MKLVLSFFLVCLVSISYQENFARPPLPYAHQRARAHYVPLFYSNGIPAGYDIIDDHIAEEINARNSNKPLSRLFGNLAQPFSNLITLTSTTTSTVVSVVTTVNNINCIPFDEFLNPNAAASACELRRRNVPEILVTDDILPDAPLPLEASAVVETLLEGKEVQQPELLSSKSDELADQPVIGAVERLFTTVKLVTVYSTTVSFTATNITATKTIAESTGLNCLPAGYIVCSA